MTDKPDLPKKLAANIRGAQRKVLSARDAILYADDSLRNTRLRIDEFEANPEAFAAKHYRGLGVESYPVQTTIRRARETRDRHLRLRPLHLQELAEAEAALAEVEAQVLVKLLHARAGSPREPWPAPLPDLEQEKQRWLARWEQELAELPARAAARAGENQAIHVAEMAEIQAQSDLDDAEAIRLFNAMSPEEQAQDLRERTYIVEGLRSGAFTIQELMEAIKQIPPKP